MTQASHLTNNDTLPLEKETPFDILIGNNLYNIHMNKESVTIGRWVTENNLKPGSSDIISNVNVHTYVSPVKKLAYFIFEEVPIQDARTSTIQELQETGIFHTIDDTVSQIAQHSTTQPTSEDMKEYRPAWPNVI